MPRILKTGNKSAHFGLALLALVFCLGAQPAQAQITFRAAGAQIAGTGASIAPAIPAGTQAGDLAILIVAGRPTNTTQPAAPAGWTLRSSSLREVGANDLKIMTFYRVLTSSNTNPTVSLPTAWQGTAAGATGQIAVWRGVNTTTPFDAADVTGNAAAGSTWTPSAVTTVTAGAWVVSAVATSDDNAVAVGTAQGFTGRMTGTGYHTTTGGDHSVALADKAQATAGTPTMLTWSQTINASDLWAGITFALRPAPDTTAPTAPSGLGATVGGAQINLAWTASTDNVGVTGYRVERCQGVGCATFAQIATSGGTTFSNAGLTETTSYSYRVRAIDAADNLSGYSNVVSATTMTAPPNVTGGAWIEYKYDAYGNLTETNAGGVITTLTYDLRGRKTQMNDPDMGIWTYGYNALGELVRQCDPETRALLAPGQPDCTDGPTGNATRMTYDLLGRMTQRKERDLISSWTYDACTKGIGKLCQVTSANDYVRTHTYDGLGRVSQIATKIDNPTPYNITYGYDSNGRPESTTYPVAPGDQTGFVTKNVYNARGYLWKVTNNAGTLDYWRADTVSATGKVLTETLGNGLTTTRGYDELERMTSNVVGSIAGGNVQEFAYAYDTIGNLKSREHRVPTPIVTENFYYDLLNRLIASNGQGVTSRDYDYDKIGNVIYKSDVGSYNYPTPGAARPHAVTSITGAANGFVNPSLTYDLNGNLKAGLGRTLTYTSFNMPAMMQGVGLAGGASSTYTYTYNADHERVKLVHSTLGTFIYLHPAGKGQLLYEKETKLDGSIEYKNYIAGVGVFVTRSNGPSEQRYFHHDHLGSLTLITNASGGVVERFAFESFGKRRYPNGSDDTNNGIFAITTDRGFTGHEHLDEIALIHMNGRIYDPVLARFMTADPFVGGASDLQSFNRYSYVNNNPLAYTDPSGYFTWRSHIRATNHLLSNPFKIQNHYQWLHTSPGHVQLEQIMQDNSWARAIGHYAASYYAGPLGSAYVSGYEVWLAGGSHNDIRRTWLKSLGTSMAMWLVSEYIPTDEYGAAANAAGHAVVGCGSAVASGGKCLSGALAGGVSALGTPLGNTGSEFANGVILATIGGTASVVGGGKFSNGAMTGAFGYLFSDGFSKNSTSDVISTDQASTGGPDICTGCAGGIDPSGLQETASTPKNVSGGGPIGADAVLGAGSTWLGPGYREIAPGVFRSADGLRQFRITDGDITGAHGRIGPHANFEALDKSGRVIQNSHVQIDTVVKPKPTLPRGMGRGGVD